MSLILVLNGWPAFIGLGFVLVPFLLGTRNRWDYFCLAAAVLPISAYVLYRYSGVYEGPRYWYEVVPFLLLLTSRGVECLAAIAPRGAAELRRRLGRVRGPPAWTSYAAVYSMLAVLFILGTGGWLFSFRSS